MSRFSRFLFATVFALFFGQSAYGSEGVFKPEQLESVITTILEKLQNTQGLPVPSLSKPEIKINDGKLAVSGDLMIAGEAMGKANLTIHGEGDEIKIVGELPDVDWGKLLSDDNLTCQVTAPASTVNFTYNTQIHVFTEGHILAQDFLIKCSEFETRLKRLEIKGITAPKDMTGRYKAQLSFLIEGMAGGAKPAKIDFSTDKISIAMDFGTVYPVKRSKAIGFGYAKYWPVKFPFLGIPGDLFLYLDPEQKEVTKLRDVLAGYDDLVINYDVQNYKYQDPYSVVSIKKQKGKLSLFKPEFVSVSEDESYIRSPDDKIKIKYPTESSFDFKIKGDPGFKNLAELGDLFKSGPAPMIFFQKFMNSYKHATFKAKAKNSDNEISIDGKVESKMDLPLPEIAGLLKIKNPEKLIKSYIVVDDSQKEQLNGCISSLEALIKSFQSLAKKNSKTTDQEWIFDVKSSFSDITINGEAVETIILPESHFTPDKCAVLGPLFLQ